jgi:hypothetical protein
MLKDDGPPMESSRRKATRKWRNHELERRVKKERAESPLEEPKELEVGDVIENEKKVAEAVTKFQTKFAKEIREMFDEHKRQNLRNLLLYRLDQRNLLYKLKLEKLRRLQGQAAQRNQETSKC